MINHSISLSCLGKNFDVAAMRGVEALSTLFSFEIKIVIDAGLDPKVFLAQPAALEIPGVDQANRKCIGRITEVFELDPVMSPYAITLLLESEVALLRDEYEPRLFLNKSSQGCVRQLLHDYPQQWLLFQKQSIQPMIMQWPRESSEHFIFRQLAKHNIIFFSECEQQQERFTFTDDYARFIHTTSMCLKENTDLYDVVKAKQWLQAVSHSSALRVGMVVSLNKENYFITKIEHHVKDFRYRNIIDAIPWGMPYEVSFRNQVKPPLLFHARIESDEPYAKLDSHGHYKLRYDFDCSGLEKCQASPFIPRMTPMEGFHSPLYDGADVVVSYLDSNPDKPIILGALTNSRYRDPVNSNNAEQSIWRTQTGLEGVLDEGVRLNAQTQWALNANGIQLSVPKGYIDMRSTQDFSINTTKAFHWNVKESIEMIAVKGVQLLARSITCDKPTNTRFRLRQSFYGDIQQLSVNTNRYLHILCQTSYAMKSQGTLKTHTTGMQSFLSTGNITLKSDGRGTMVLQQGDAVIKINANAEVFLSAKSIHCAAEALELHGNVEFA